MRLRVFLLWAISILCSAVSCSAADRILFTRLAPSQATLYISKADGSEEHPLIQPGALDYNPAWSPDGKWIVFTSERAGSADLFRVRPDGTGLERLTDDPAYDDQAAFSPDGKQIVFVTTRADGTADLWILDPETRKAKPLTSGPGGDFRPSWSPDGKWIAFSSDRESTLPMAKGRWEHLHLVDIYLIRPDASGLKRLTPHGDFCGSPKWSRDSKSVVAYCMPAQDTWTYRGRVEEGSTRLVRIDVSTGETAEVAAGPGVKMFPAVLPSGEIAYVRKDTSAPGLFYGAGKPGPTGDVRCPSWSPDGTRLVYGRFGPMATSGFQKLWSRNPRYELISTGMLPAYDSSGDRFVATTLGREGHGSALTISENGNPARTLLERKDELILGPQWSPRGDGILFGIGQFTAFLDFAVGDTKPPDPANGGAQLAMINADGTGFRQITSGANNNGFPAFAPDGKGVVYRTMGPDGSGLRIMNMDDRSVAVLTNEYDNFPVWSPRGDLIAFIRKIEGDFEVFSIRPDGKDLRRLTNSRGNEAHLAWSPDGEKLLFSSTRMGFKDEALYTLAPQPYGELFIMRYDGTQVEQLTDNQWEEAGPAWQPRKQNMAGLKNPAR
jgi:TolB protein